ncbi:hypothetical protein RZS08_06925, partial [Arthrospira platensis SPKY1]|nr:hypothetical protein [Arthrospira platensis SPKY1]
MGTTAVPPPQRVHKPIGAPTKTHYRLPLRRDKVKILLARSRTVRFRHALVGMETELVNKPAAA